MNELKKNIFSMYNDEGKEWLDSLPEITAKIVKEHNLSDLTPVINMTFNYLNSPKDQHNNQSSTTTRRFTSRWHCEKLLN